MKKRKKVMSIKKQNQMPAQLTVLSNEEASKIIAGAAAIALPSFLNQANKIN